MTGTIPSKNAGPDCVCQHDGRNHQVAVHNHSSTIAMCIFRRKDERISSGVWRKRLATRIVPMIGAMMKKMRSQRLRGVHAVDRQMEHASSALLADEDALVRNIA